MSEEQNEKLISGEIVALLLSYSAWLKEKYIFAEGEHGIFSTNFLPCDPDVAELVRNFIKEVIQEDVNDTKCDESSEL